MTEEHARHKGGMVASAVVTTTGRSQKKKNLKKKLSKKKIIFKIYDASPASLKVKSLCNNGTTLQQVVGSCYELFSELLEEFQNNLVQKKSI